MARRLNTANAESVRQKIRVVLLINRLQDHADGKVDMTATQVDAAKFLINKITPNAPERREIDLNGGITVTVKHYGAVSD